MRALLVEDSASTRKLLKTVISPYAEVVEAENGRTAVELYRAAVESADPFNYVFLDLVMPEMDGIEVLSAIRDDEETRQVPPDERAQVIVVSGHTEGDNIYDAYIRDCAAFLVKPIEREKLLREMRRIGLVPPSGSPSRVE